MTHGNSDSLICKAIAAAAGLGEAGFLYYLWTCGLSLAGLAVALGMALFVSAITVAGAAMAFRSKEQ